MPNSSHQPRTRIFISHSTKDIDFVRRLSKDLSFILDDEDAVWYDVLVIGGEAWWSKIVHEITTRKVFLLILSPDAMSSPWVADEIRMAWRHKNLKNKARKEFKIIHFRECTNKIPKHLDYLKDIQWIQFLPPETYRSALINLLKALKTPLTPKVRDFLRRLEHLDPDFVLPVTPKTTADFDEKEREQILTSLGKFTTLYISQNRWDDVVLCAEQALALAPSDLNWHRIKDEAYSHLEQTNSILATQIFNELPADDKERKKGSSSFDGISKSKGQQSKVSNTVGRSQNIKRHLSEPDKIHSSHSPQRNSSFRKSNISSSPLQRDFSTGTINFSENYKKSIQKTHSNRLGHDYLLNLAKFLSKFIHIDGKFFLIICLLDLLLVPCLIGFWQLTYILQLIGVSFFLSIIALILGPITRNRKMSLVSVTFFTLSWAFGGWFLGSMINTLIDSVHGIYGDPITNEKFVAISIVISVLAALTSMCLHLVTVLCTDHLLSNK